jgi:hypothetical protein
LPEFYFLFSVILFFCFGLFAGYILTRIDLAPIFGQADKETLEFNKEELIQKALNPIQQYSYEQDDILRILLKQTIAKIVERSNLEKLAIWFEDAHWITDRSASQRIFDELFREQGIRMKLHSSSSEFFEYVNKNPNTRINMIISDMQRVEKEGEMPVEDAGWQFVNKLVELRADPEHPLKKLISEEPIFVLTTPTNTRLYEDRFEELRRTKQINVKISSDPLIIVQYWKDKFSSQPVLPFGEK